MKEAEPGNANPEQFRGWEIKHRPPTLEKGPPLYQEIPEFYHPEQISRHGSLVEFLIDTSDPEIELSSSSQKTLAHYTAESALNGLRFYVYVELKDSDPDPSKDTLEKIIKSRPYVVVVSHGLMGGANVVIGNDSRSRVPIVGKGLTLQEIEGLPRMDWSKETVNTAAVLAHAIPDSVIIVPDINNGAGAVGDAPWFKPERDYPLRSVNAIGYQLLAHLNMLGLLSGLPSSYQDLDESIARIPTVSEHRRKYPDFGPRRGDVMIKHRRRILFSGHSMGGAGPMEASIIYNELMRIISTNDLSLNENDRSILNVNEMAEVLMLAYNAAYIKGWQRSLFELFGETRRLKRLVNPFVWPLTFFMLDKMPPKLRGIYARNYQDSRYWDTFRAACYSLSSPEYSVPPSEIGQICGMLVTANPEADLNKWERLARKIGAPRDLLVSETNLRYILTSMGWPGLIRTVPVGHTGPWAGYDGLLEYTAAVRASLTLMPEDFKEASNINTGLDNLVTHYRKYGIQPTSSLHFQRACVFPWERINPLSEDWLKVDTVHPLNDHRTRENTKEPTPDDPWVQLMNRLVEESDRYVFQNEFAALAEKAALLTEESALTLLNLPIATVIDKLRLIEIPQATADP